MKVPSSSETAAVLTSELVESGTITSVVPLLDPLVEAPPVVATPVDDDPPLVDDPPPTPRSPPRQARTRAHIRGTNKI